MADKSQRTLDRTDLRILSILEADGRISMSELAEKVSLSQSPCWRRVQLLEQAGYITGYHAQLNRKMLGLGVHGFVNVEVRDPSLAAGNAFEREVAVLPGVISCYNLSGIYDYQIELLAPDLPTFAKLLRTIRGFPGTTKIVTSFTLNEIKTNGSLPIGG